MRSGGPGLLARADGGDMADAPGALLGLALHALRGARTREELLDHAARVTAATVGGDYSKILERVPDGAGGDDFLMTSGAGWPEGSGLVGALRVPGGADASPSGRAEARGAVQDSGSDPLESDAALRVPDALLARGVRSALDAPIPREAAGAGPRSHGVLQADSRRRAAFGERERGLLARVAEVLGAALDARDREAAAARARDDLHALLLAEAEHRIANSLQTVAASLALQAGLAEDQPEVAGRLRAAAARVAAAGALHRHLQRLVEREGPRATGGAATVDAAALFRAVCADLARLLGSGDGTRLAHEAGPGFSWPAARAGALATIAAELALNAAKHGGASGAVALRLAAAPDGDALVSAEDEGPGFPGDFDAEAAPGLGLRLVRALAGPGPGRLEVGRGEGRGRVVVKLARAV